MTRPIRSKYRRAHGARLRKGEPVSLVKWCVYTDSRRHAAPLASGDASWPRLCAETPIETWYARQRAILKTFWDVSRVIGSKGHPRCSSASISPPIPCSNPPGRTASPPSRPRASAAKATRGIISGIRDLYVPVLPAHAAADRAKAAWITATKRWTAASGMRASLGHEKGALYPWRTITGSECSSYYPSGSAQYHINSDIAHAVITYYFMTGDLEYHPRQRRGNPDRNVPPLAGRRALAATGSSASTASPARTSTPAW